MSISRLRHPPPRLVLSSIKYSFSYTHHTVIIIYPTCALLGNRADTLLRHHAAVFWSDQGNGSQRGPILLISNDHSQPTLMWPSRVMLAIQDASLGTTQHEARESTLC